MPKRRRTKPAKPQLSAPTTPEGAVVAHQRPDFEERGPVANENEPVEWPAPSSNGSHDYGVAIHSEPPSVAPHDGLEDASR